MNDPALSCTDGFGHVDWIFALHSDWCGNSLCIVPRCQQRLLLKFHPLCAAQTHSKNVMLSCYWLSSKPRERYVSQHQGHGLCTVRAVSHWCMKHMALMCACLFYSGCGLVYIKLFIIFQRKPTVALWLCHSKCNVQTFAMTCNQQHKINSNIYSPV